jgi:hypothetical protein
MAKTMLADRESSVLSAQDADKATLSESPSENVPGIIPGRASFLRRHLICRFQMCQTFAQKDNDTHLWGECTVCGKRSGVISRAAVRRYLEAEEYYRDFLAKQGLAFDPAGTVPKQFFNRPRPMKDEAR